MGDHEFIQFMWQGLKYLETTNQSVKGIHAPMTICDERRICAKKFLRRNMDIMNSSSFRVCSIEKWQGLGYFVTTKQTVKGVHVHMKILTSKLKS